MKRAAITRLRAITIAVVSIALGACSTNGTAQMPSVTHANLAANSLQLAVGTATIAQDGTVGLNVVATLRQPNGLSGTLVNTPALIGPAGFALPAGIPGSGGPGNVDGGTNKITASPQTPVNQTPANTTLGVFDGVFSYGIGPFNTDTTQFAYFPGNPSPAFSSSAYNGTSVISSSLNVGDVTQPEPFFSTDGFDYLGGPPAFPFFLDGVTEPSPFAGYGQGFAVFETGTPPATGTYTLTVSANPSNGSPVNYTATSTLVSNAPLPALLAPVVTSATGGGLNGTIAVPPNPRITETLVYLAVSHNGSLHFYTAGPLSGTGTLSFSFPATLGPCAGVGCQNTSAATPTLATGDSYFLAAVSFDYPAFEAAPPNSTSQNPTITGATGSADLSMSPVSGPNTY